MALEELLLRLRNRIGPHRHLNPRIRIEGHDEPTAELRLVEIDHGNREMAKDLAEIGLRVEDAIEHRGDHHQPHHAAVSQDAANLGDDDASTSRCRRRGTAERIPRQPDAPALRRASAASRHQARPPKSRANAGEDGERPGGIGNRRAARGLVEEDLHVPAQRQDGSPAPGEGLHAGDGKADTGIAEGGRDHDGREAEPQRQIADEQDQQGCQPLIGGDEQTGRGDHHPLIAAKGNLIGPVDDQQQHDHHQHEDGEERRQLAGQGRQRASAGRAQPGSRRRAARTRFRSHSRWKSR